MLKTPGWFLLLRRPHGGQPFPFLWPRLLPGKRIIMDRNSECKLIERLWCISDGSPSACCIFAVNNFLQYTKNYEEMTKNCHCYGIQSAWCAGVTIFEVIRVRSCSMSSRLLMRTFSSWLMTWHHDSLFTPYWNSSDRRPPYSIPVLFVHLRTICT